jgi:phosphoribosylformylglycinamidine synthase
VHDLSDGGLVAAAAEMALASRVGAAITAPDAPTDLSGLFGEDQARYLLAVRPERLDEIDARAEAAGVPYAVVGRAGGDELSFSGEAGLLCAHDLDALRAAHEAWMPGFMEG